MALPRDSAFLPTIKCSSCGNQVEISMMGDHICRGQGPTAELSPPPELSDELDDEFDPSPVSRHGRTPPKLDTSVDNRPFTNRGQLTPVSQTSESRVVSPMTPGWRTAPGPPHDAYSRSPDQTRRPGRHGGSDDRGKEEAGPGKQAGGGGILDRMMSSTAPGTLGTGRRSPAAKNAFPSRNGSFGKWDGPSADELLARPMDRPGTSHSNMSVTVAPPKMPRKNGYGGFGPPAASGSAGAGELELPPPGFLSQSGANSPSRLSSASSARSDRIRNAADERKRAMTPDTSRKPPPRTSLLGQHAPKNVSVDLAAEFGIGNPYHTPSDSISSGYSSTFSHASQPSSTQTSPARSQTSPARSHARRSDDLVPPPRMDSGALQTPVESLRARSPRVDPSVQPARRGPAQLAESPFGASPRAERNGPAVRSGNGKLDLPPSAMPYSASPPGDGDDWRRPGLGPRKASREPMALPSRGDCRGCRLPIRGKSISSADGRLTGKYHKACFVCAACSRPFASAEFYVLDDKPYCEQHYHKLNGSLCGSCGRGIEGQYLEDEGRVKYHVGCFRCLDCGRSLSDGYFDVDGKAYCERDAWRRTQPPGPDALAPPRPAYGMGGLPGRPGPRPGQPGPPGPRAGYGAAPGHGAAPGGRMGGGMQPLPRMNKRMTRLGQM